MKAILLLGGAVFAGVMAWRIAGIISPDAISMALGLFFGVLAACPIGLLIMTGQRPTHSHREPPPPPSLYYIDQRPTPQSEEWHQPRPYRIEHTHQMVPPPRRPEPRPERWRVIGQDVEVDR